MEKDENGFYRVTLKELDVPSPYNGKIYSSTQLAEVFKTAKFERRLRVGLPVVVPGTSSDMSWKDMAGMVTAVEITTDGERTFLMGRLKPTGPFADFIDGAVEPCFGIRCLTSVGQDDKNLKIEQLLGFNLIAPPSGE